MDGFRRSTFAVRSSRFSVLAGLWLVTGVVIFNAFFDLYVSRGAREYLQKRAEYELRGGPEPQMDAVMAQSVRDAWIMSSVWTGLVVVAGAATMKIMKDMKEKTLPSSS